MRQIAARRPRPAKHDRSGRFRRNGTGSFPPGRALAPFARMPLWAEVRNPGIPKTLAAAHDDVRRPIGRPRPFPQEPPGNRSRNVALRAHCRVADEVGVGPRRFKTPTSSVAAACRRSRRSPDPIPRHGLGAAARPDRALECRRLRFRRPGIVIGLGAAGIDAFMRGPQHRLDRGEKHANGRPWILRGVAGTVY